MTKIFHFIQLGEYGKYILGSYGCFILIFLTNIIVPLCNHRQLLKNYAKNSSQSQIQN